MKKLFGIVIVISIWCNSGFASIYEMNKCYWKEFGSWEGMPEEYISEGDLDNPLIKYPERIKDYKVGQLITRQEDEVFTINVDLGLVTHTQIFAEEYRKYMDSLSAAWGDMERYPKVWTRDFKIINFTAGYIVAEERRSDGLIYTTEVDLKAGKVYFSGNLNGPKKLLTTYICESKYANSTDTNGEPKSSSGTAFFISKKGHLLTNNHVVEGCKISKITYKNKDYDTKLLAIDQTLDLALLKADIKPSSYFTFSSKDIKKLNKVYVAGYPLGKGLSDDLKISSGIVSSLKGYKDNSNEIQIDAPINSGNSGGPIINENGDLIAIAVSGLAKDQTEGINFGIKSTAAELFLRSNNISPKKSMYSGIKDNDKLLEILEQGTVYTYCN